MAADSFQWRAQVFVIRLSFIEAQSTNLVREGRLFFAVGFNAYYLAYCSERTQRSVLRSMREAGATAVRAWAFLDIEDGERQRPAFQIFSQDSVRVNEAEDGLLRLDSLIANAETAGIALLLPLINGWRDFGGMPLYSRCFGAGDSSDEFYSSAAAVGAYRRWVERVLTRRNTQTGRFYLDEPSIFAWELANEPRHSGKDGAAQMLAWVARSSDFIKQIDSNHLLAVGDEGFFRRRGRSHLYDGRYGVDTEAFLNLDAIDVGSYHFYPEHWGVPVYFGERWIQEHAELATRVGKPVMLEEFGLTKDASVDRIDQYLEWVRLACMSGSAGALVWMLGSTEADAASYRDRFTLRAVSEA